MHDARRNSPDETVVQASTCARGGSDREEERGSGYPGHGARDHAHLSQRRVHLPSDRVLQRAVAHLVVVAFAKAVAHRAAQQHALARAVVDGVAVLRLLAERGTRSSRRRRRSSPGRRRDFRTRGRSSHRRPPPSPPRSPTCARDGGRVEVDQAAPSGGRGSTRCSERRRARGRAGARPHQTSPVRRVDRGDEGRIRCSRERRRRAEEGVHRELPAGWEPVWHERAGPAGGNSRAGPAQERYAAAPMNWPPRAERANKFPATFRRQRLRVRSRRPFGASDAIEEWRGPGRGDRSSMTVLSGGDRSSRRRRKSRSCGSASAGVHVQREGLGRLLSVGQACRRYYDTYGIYHTFSALTLVDSRAIGGVVRAAGMRRRRCR